ncbi:hypothetical protein [Allocoleopsis franciscana]|nr:hypothetical protein [Allocoleopsis franciscana]
MCIKHRSSQSPRLVVVRLCGTEYGLALAIAGEAMIGCELLGEFPHWNCR